MKFTNQHILSTDQFDRAALVELFETAREMEKVVVAGGNDLLAGKIMATLFFEPSTRTRFSFETAMLRLGGKLISNADMMATSSVKKQETLFDTGKMVSSFADVIVMRHPLAGSVAELAAACDVPVFNAGDGAHDHPSQGLLDLYTIWKEKGGFDGLKVGLIGDLKYGRVPHSQAKLLAQFGVSMIFVAPDGLQMPEDVCARVKELGANFEKMENLEEVIGDLDVISMTRIQQERFASEEEYRRYAGSYILDSQLISRAKKDAIVIHPLPRVDEITTEIDNDPRAKYFDQVKNGVAVRMALLKLVLT